MKCIVVSGRSGSGKSIVLRLLEDLGFYCVDNLPISLLPALEAQIQQPIEKSAVSIDARNISIDVEKLDEILKLIKHPRRAWEIIYLDADDTTLLKRFSETRRRHPLTNTETTLQEAIALEKKLLEPLCRAADIKIDTKDLSIHQLREMLSSRLLSKPENKTSVLFQSFGFKNGLPTESDFVFDVRLLPNPYWVPELRSATGLMPSVIEYLSSKPTVQAMVQDLTQFLEPWLRKVESDQRSYVTISIGCTGGQHRSVYVTETLQKYFAQQLPHHVQSRHRDLKK